MRVRQTLRRIAERVIARQRTRNRIQAGDMQSIFCDIYRQRLWGDGESVSGPGSGLERTSAFRDDLAVLLNEFGVRSLLDAGCGDFNWQQAIDVRLDTYIGVDVIPDFDRRQPAKVRLARRTFSQRGYQSRSASRL